MSPITKLERPVPPLVGPTAVPDQVPEVIDPTEERLAKVVIEGRVVVEVIQKSEEVVAQPPVDV